MSCLTDSYPVDGAVNIKIVPGDALMIMDYLIRGGLEGIPRFTYADVEQGRIYVHSPSSGLTKRDQNSLWLFFRFTAPDGNRFSAFRITPETINGMPPERREARESVWRRVDGLCSAVVRTPP
jgi:hypothetical protein